MSERVPKICDHEMVRIGRARYAWLISGAVRVEIWEPWWADYWRARVWLLAPGYEQNAYIELRHLASTADGAALVVSDWLRKVSESLVFAISRPVEER